MLAELKMVCAQRRCQSKNRPETIKPVDIIAAIRNHIENLTSQDQLDRLGNSVKDKYKDVFSPIPHIDDLPTDVYC
jgi:hypothetical protein